MSRARECLSNLFPDITFTDAILSPAYGAESDSDIYYSNMLAHFTTQQSVEELTLTLKEMEKQLGDSASLRAQGTVMMDLDLLKHGRKRMHLADWRRTYIKDLLTLLKKQSLPALLLAASLCLSAAASQNIAAAGTTVETGTTAAGTMVSSPMPQQQEETPQELLTKAIEYFQGGKYHEAILAFTKLQEKYTLNPRFMAYLGMSYYKEGMYEEAAFNLKKGIPALTAFSPNLLRPCAAPCGGQRQRRCDIPHRLRTLSHGWGQQRLRTLYLQYVRRGFGTLRRQPKLCHRTAAFPLTTDTLHAQRP